MHEHLAEFIRAHRDEIVDRWLEQVSALPSAAGQGEATLRDHIPEILDHLADEIARGDRGDALEDLAGKHAVLRYRGGYNLRQVLLEYHALRRTIQTMYEQHELDAGVILRRFVALDQFVDDVIGDAVEHYAYEHDRVRDVFVAVLGHDLRTPLQAIVSAGTAVANGPHEPQAGALIVRSARRMGRMIADLLDFARTRLGDGIPLARAELDLRALVAEVVEELAAANPSRSLTLSADGGDFVGRWDGDRVAQALSNLVTNAVEHGEDPIVVRCVDEVGCVVVEVDNGGVIEVDALADLFKPFHAGKSSSGLGLGLYVVHEIARAHGGLVEARSEGQSTRFRLVLPRADT